MSDKNSELGPLPPGWDTKFDPRTGKYYYINHYTKTTSWEDPRVRYLQIGKATSKENKNDNSSSSTMAPPPDHVSTSASESVPLKSYPIGTIPPANSDDLQHQLLQDVSNTRKGASSPVLNLRSSTSGGIQYGGVGSSVHPAASPLPLQRLQLEDIIGGSPMSQRSIVRRESHVLADISEVDTLDSTAMTDQAVHNISAMFPTVEESHIRDLLKKYHNSQAVVISALQVAKHPFITPGPSTVFTPPPTRHSTLPGVAQGVLAGITMTGSLPHHYGNLYGNMTPLMGLKNSNGHDDVSSSGYPTPRPGSAASGFDSFYMGMGSPQIGASTASGIPGGPGQLFRSFPRPHSSPKMKLRYLKSVFPTVEEYLLLDVLTNNDNNVQKAADKLVKMGYVKRDTPSAPRLHARRKEEERLAEKRTPLPKPPPIKTDKEKDDLRKKMKDKYESKYDIPERILFMALESVLFDEEQANHLVLSMIEDDLKRKKSKEAEKAKEKAKEKHTRKSPKPNRRSMDAEKIASHPSPKHEPKKMTSHGKKGWTSKSNIKEEVLVKPASKASTTTSQTPQVCSGRALGPNPGLRKGPNDDLLLTDYVTWNGPDPDIKRGPSNLDKGPNPDNTCTSTTRQSLAKGSRLAKGPNPDKKKGPQGLAMGSIFLQKKAEGSRTR